MPDPRMPIKDAARRAQRGLEECREVQQKLAAHDEAVAVRQQEVREALEGRLGEGYRAFIQTVCDYAVIYPESEELPAAGIRFTENKVTLAAIEEALHNKNLSFKDFIGPHGGKGISSSMFGKLRLSSLDVTLRGSIFSMKAEVFLDICAACGMEIPEHLERLKTAQDLSNSKKIKR